MRPFTRSPSFAITGSTPASSSSTTRCSTTGKARTSARGVPGAGPQEPALRLRSRRLLQVDGQHKDQQEIERMVREGITMGIHCGSRALDGSFWRQRSVFVTGCTGFRLLVDGSPPRSGRSRGGSRARPRAGFDPRPFLACPRSTPCRVARGLPAARRALNEYAVDTVFHVGAQAIVGTRTGTRFHVRGQRPRDLEPARGLPPQPSRASRGGRLERQGVRQPRGAALRRGSPLRGRHPYDVSKSCADLIAAAYHNTYRLPVA